MACADLSATSGAADHRRQDGLAAALLWVLACALYILSSGGHPYGDDRRLYAVAKSIVDRKSLAVLDRDPWALEDIAGGPYHVARVFIDGDGNRRAYIAFGLPPSLLQAPLYWLGRTLRWPADLPPQPWPEVGFQYPLAGLAYNTTLTATAVALTYLLGRRLGLAPWPAAASALLFAFATVAWVYAKTLFNLPLAVLGLLGACFAWDRCLGRAAQGRLCFWPAAAAGALLGLAAATRPEYLLFAPALGLAWWLNRYSKRAGRSGGYPQAPGRTGKALAGPSLNQAAAGLALGAAPFLLLAAGYNWLKSGVPWETGYHSQQALDAYRHLAEGLPGLLVSPGFGVLVYMPVLFVGALRLPALARLGGHARGWAWGFAWITAVAVAFYGSFEDWTGGASWGPRFLLGPAPFLCLAAAAALQPADRPAPLAQRLAAGAVLMTGGWGFAVNALGAAFDFNQGWLEVFGAGGGHAAAAWRPEWSLPWVHLRLLRLHLTRGWYHPDSYLWYKAGLAGAGVALGIAVLAAGGIAFVLRPFQDAAAGLSVPLEPEKAAPGQGRDIRSARRPR